MDPEAFTACLFKWDPRVQHPSSRGVVDMVAQLQPQTQPAAQPVSTLMRPSRTTELGGLEVLFQAYGIRYYTAAKIGELGFTVNTLINMKDEELDEMMNALSQIFRWELLVGERYGIKAAIRAERTRRQLIDEEEQDSRRRHLLLSADTTHTTHDAFSQQGMSEEPVQREKESGGVTWEVGEGKKQIRRKKKNKKNKKDVEDDQDMNIEDDDDDDGEDVTAGQMIDRQREHPFIVTEPGEVARGKKNGLDYLFHLYQQCKDFLIQVQNIAKDRGEKCPTKVTNQVFRYAKKAGASYINKPKMRHYVHCYALHCLDEETSNAIRKAYKERGENVGAWRQACYKPLVAIAARQGWDIDAIFNAHPKLACWYVPTKLRQLCHAERNNVAAAASSSASGGGCGDHIPF